MDESIGNISQQLKSQRQNVSELSATIGFDGFIDEITRVVKSREDTRNYSLFKTISEFSAYTANAAGKSADIEIIGENIKLGGNAPIMANALACLGVDTTCIGAMGYPEVDSVFKKMSSGCRIISVCNPARTYAFEFDDGKLMFANLKPFEDLTWERIKEFPGLKNMAKILGKSSLTALVNWSTIQNTWEIWKGILDEVIKQQYIAEVPKANLFFDLADPSRRSRKDIFSVVQLISEYSSYCNVTLGLNENEARRIFKALNDDAGLDNGSSGTGKENSISLEDIGINLFNAITVDTLLIHPLDSCLAITGSGICKRAGKFIKNPKISTGGGDNFNAGYCLGKLLGFGTGESMVVGMAASGSYVRNGCSPTFPELIRYMEEWASEII